MTLYERLLDQHKKTLELESIEYPTIIGNLIDALNSIESVRDLKVGYAFDLLVHLNMENKDFYTIYDIFE
jgi:hypothetical protein